MYCRFCGKPVPDDSKFCPQCGASQGIPAQAPVRPPVQTPVRPPVQPPVQNRPSQPAPKSKSGGGKVWGAVLTVIGILVIVGGISNGSYETMYRQGVEFSDIVSLGIGAFCLLFGFCLLMDITGFGQGFLLFCGAAAILVFALTSGQEPQPAREPEVTFPRVTTATTAATTQPPKENILEYIPSSWDSENRKLDNGGNCGVMKMDEPVYRCTQVDFTMSAEGNYGATTVGNWEVHFRVNGTWQHIATVYYGGGGEETFTIRFSAPTNFDAVCAFPKQTGNYSYQSLYYLSNAHLD